MTGSTPILHPQFVKALEELPFIALIDKARELSNSMKHLQSSNAQLAEFPDDDVCQQAIEENKEVMVRLKERFLAVQEELLKRPNGMHLPIDYAELTALFKKELEKDVDREIAAFEKAMKKKYGDEWIGAEERTSRHDLPNSASSTVPTNPSGLTGHQDAEPTDRSNHISGQAGSSPSQQPESQKPTGSGRYNDRDLSELLNQRLQDMGVNGPGPEGEEKGIFL